jgi:hypothetical protein
LFEAEKEKEKNNYIFIDNIYLIITFKNFMVVFCPHCLFFLVFRDVLFFCDKKG